MPGAGYLAISAANPVLGMVLDGLLRDPRSQRERVLAPRAADRLVCPDDDFLSIDPPTVKRLSLRLRGRSRSQRSLSKLPAHYLVARFPDMIIDHHRARPAMLH